MGGLREAERDSTRRGLRYYDRLSGRMARPRPNPLYPVLEVPIVSLYPYGVALRGGCRDPEARKARLVPEVNKRLKARILNLSPSKGLRKASRPQDGYCGPNERRIRPPASRRPS